MKKIKWEQRNIQFEEEKNVEAKSYTEKNQETQRRLDLLWNKGNGTLWAKPSSQASKF